MNGYNERGIDIGNEIGNYCYSIYAARLTIILWLKISISCLVFLFMITSRETKTFFSQMGKILFFANAANINRQS